MKKILKILLLISIIEIMILLNIFVIFNALGCNKGYADGYDSDTIDTEKAVIDIFVVSSNSLVSHDIEDLRYIEETRKASLYDYIKRRKVSVLDSDRVINIIKEDNSHDYLYIKTSSGDSVWIKKQNVSKESVEL